MIIQQNEGNSVYALYKIENGSTKIQHLFPLSLKVSGTAAEGIKILETGSAQGDKSCSLQLAKYFAGACQYMVNTTPDADKAKSYLRLAEEQGSTTAKGIRERAGTFGRIELSGAQLSLR